MPVPAFRQSPGRTRRRRAHDSLKPTSVVMCASCGAWKRPHNACRSCGYVRPGLQVKATRPGA